MGKSQKGTEIERKAKDALEASGYLVHRTVRTPIVRWVNGQAKVMGSHNNDVFGVFDLLATSPAELRCIQVTVEDGVSTRKKKIRAVADRFPGFPVSVEVWGWVGGTRRLDRSDSPYRFTRRQYFRTWRWSGDGWEETTDPRAGWVDDPADADYAAGIG